MGKWEMWIFLLLSLGANILCERINCNWEYEYLCGNQCLGEDNLCMCGNDPMTLADAYVYNCCNQGTCSKDMDGNVKCHGSKQNWRVPCNEICKQTAYWGLSTMACEDKEQCVKSITLCRGVPICHDLSDLWLCTKPNGINCEENFHYEECEQLIDNDFKNYGCKYFEGVETEYFQCSNRMDKKEVLFDRPPISVKEVRKARNYNTALLFDDFYIYCGKYNFTYEDFYQVSRDYGVENCDLADGDMETIEVLWEDLIRDFSFKMTEKMNDVYGDKIRHELEFVCELGGPYICDSTPNFCIYQNAVCDSVANCPNGDDEVLETCIEQEVFSDMATIECDKKDVYNVTIKIRAIPCDGIYECKDDEDERNCSLPDFILIVALAIIIICFGIFGYLLQKANSLILTKKNQMLTLPDFERSHGTEALKEAMFQAQNLENFDCITSDFANFEMKVHNGVLSEAVNCMKNNLDSQTVAKVMSNFPEKKESFFGKLFSKVKEKFVFERRKTFFSKIILVKIVLIAVSQLFDLIKDSVILVEISRSQGGVWNLFTRQSKPYITWIFLALLFSIFVPVFLGCLQLFKQRPNVIFHNFQKCGIFKKLGMLFILPFYPIYFKIQEALLREASEDYIVSIDSLEEMIYYSVQFMQIEIGLESHLQLIISISLLLLAHSQTNTITGLEVLFEKETFFYLNAKLALGLSIIWSLVSCIKSHMAGISKQRQHSTAIASVTIFLFTSASIALRVFSCVLYLTPAFGLFNSLRHLQGELYQHWALYYYPEDIIDFKFFFGNATPINWTEVSRWNYDGGNARNAEPPQITLYIWLSIEKYFGIFLGIFAIQIAFQLVLKMVINPLEFQMLSWIDCIIHTLSCCFIPLPMKEWDMEKGTVAIHKVRKDLVFKEMLASIVLNFGFNLILLTPLIILGINIFDRHDILVNSIGAFPEEVKAYEQIQWMIQLSYSLLLLLTLVQIVTYHLYNGKFHPFALIVMPEPEHSAENNESSLETETHQSESMSASDIFYNYDSDSSDEYYSLEDFDIDVPIPCRQIPF